jgi:hypothetical protein
MAGNFYGLKPQTGRLDASYGVLFLGDKSHGLDYVQPSESGLFVRGEARDIALVKAAGGGSYVLVAMNNADLCLFKKQ